MQPRALTDMCSLTPRMVNRLMLMMGLTTGASLTLLLTVQRSMQAGLTPGLWADLQCDPTYRELLSLSSTETFRNIIFFSFLTLYFWLLGEMCKRRQDHDISDNHKTQNTNVGLVNMSKTGDGIDVSDIIIYIICSSTFQHLLHPSQDRDTECTTDQLLSQTNNQPWKTQ